MAKKATSKAKKAAPKKGGGGSSKGKPKKAAKSKTKAKGKAKGKTKAKATNRAPKSSTRRDWNSIVDSIRKGKVKKVTMGSEGSAQVTRVRVLDEYNVYAWTEGANLFLSLSPQK